MAGPQIRQQEDDRTHQVPKLADQYPRILAQLRDPSPQVRQDAIRTLTGYVESNMRPIERSDAERFFPVLAKAKELQRTLGSDIDFRFFPVILFQRIDQIRTAVAGLTITDADPAVRRAAESALERIDGIMNENRRRAGEGR